MSDPRENLPRGAAFMTGSALLFAAMGVGVKVASASLPNTMVVFARNAISLVALLPWIAGLGLRGLATTRPGEHLLRGLAGLSAMYCFFYAIAHLRLADAVLLNFSLPLFIPLVERAWLGEPVPSRIWGPIGLGLLGLVLVLKPGLGLFQPAALVGVAAAVLAAVAQVGVRQLTRTEPVTRIVFYFCLTTTVVSSVPAALTWSTPAPALWGVLVATGVLATLGQLFLTRAYACASAARVGPFVYSSVLFAAAFDWLLWGSLPDALSLAGAAVVITAGVLALRMENTEPA